MPPPAAQGLLSQAGSASFWERAASPVWPISRKDTKEIGDIKEGLSTGLIGLAIRTDARSPELADQMVQLLGEFYANALIRERIRTWINGGLGETRTRQLTLRADIIASQLNIETTKRRIADLKTIVVRYPEAARSEGRQVVSIAEGGDRFLPPPAQLVAAESGVAQIRESILRSERQVRQLDRLATFYLAAEAAFKGQPLTRKLVPELHSIADKIFSGADADEEWLRESFLRTQGTIAGLGVAQEQFGIRNGARVTLASRGPARLGLIGAALAFVLLGAAAFIRMNSRSQVDEPSTGEVHVVQGVRQAA